MFDSIAMMHQFQLRQIASQMRLHNEPVLCYIFAPFSVRCWMLRRQNIDVKILPVARRNPSNAIARFAILISSIKIFNRFGALLRRQFLALHRCRASLFPCAFCGVGNSIAPTSAHTIQQRNAISFYDAGYCACRGLKIAGYLHRAALCLICSTNSLFLLRCEFGFLHEISLSLKPVMHNQPHFITTADKAARLAASYLLSYFT